MAETRLTSKSYQTLLTDIKSQIRTAQVRAAVTPRPELYENSYTNIVTGPVVKPVRWLGSSKKDVKSFPAAVRREIGTALFAAQRGFTDPAVKPLKGLGGGVIEILTSYIRGTWRTVHG